MKKFGIKSKFSVPLIGLFALVMATNQIAFSQYVCQTQGAAIVQTGSITAADPLQTTRVFRDGVPSSCTGGTPVNAAVAGSYRHDAYNFTNPTGADACVSVEYNMTGCGVNSTQINAYSTFNPAVAGANVIGKPGFSTVASGVLTFNVAAGASFVVVVHEVAAGTGCANYTFSLKYRTGCREPGYDRSNDGKADPTFFTPSTGIWSVLNSAGGTNSLTFGQLGDTITPGDYTGDGQTDVSTYRSTTNTWFYSTSQTSPQTNVTYVPWGVAGDVPVPGDYDRDGISDVAVWRPTDGRYYTLRSSDSTFFAYKWGANGDTPVTGDYDGDLVTDFGVVRTVGGSRQWYVVMSNFGYGFTLGCPSTAPFCGPNLTWGLTTDRIVTGDFDGDARADIAVFRPSDGTWYYRRSGTVTASGALGTPAGFVWGGPGDIPQPADYDGDKRTDFAVFRPTTGVWHISNSTNGTYASASTPSWGTATDQPATSPYLITNP